jgi:hypothetical protein
MFAKTHILIVLARTKDHPDEIARDHQTGKLVAIGGLDPPSKLCTMMTTTVMLMATFQAS